mgnify:CR=1 FL=1
MIMYIFLTVSTLVLTKMFFENFIEESKSNKPCKWVITKHFRINLNRIFIYEYTKTILFVFYKCE